jgi:eukaryotic-like serine/threonine-protein kinase
MNMKNKTLTLIVFVLVLASLLSACAGGGRVTVSWPNLTVDSKNETVLMANGSYIYEVNLSNGTEKLRYPTKAGKATFYAPPALGADGQIYIGGYDFVFYNLKLGIDQPVWTFSEATDHYIAGALVDSSSIYAPAGDAYLYALDTNGNLRWKFKADHALWATPVLDGTTLYVSSLDHHIYALDAGTGNLIWKSDDLGGAIVATPTLGPDGSLYVGTFGMKTDNRDKGSRLLAVDSSSGKMRWSMITKGWVFASPLLVDGTLYLGDSDGNFYAVDAQGGTVRWQIQPDTTTNRSITSAPILVGDTVYFASKAGILYAVKAADGSMLWNKPIGCKDNAADNRGCSEIYTDLVLAGDMILIAPMKTDAVLVAVDVNGNQKWAYTPAK